MPEQDPPTAPSMSHPPKKKRTEDHPLPHDAGQKPVQVQRRRVWRACESCRRKKIKCDGNEPICSQCSGSRTQCTWLQTKDRAALSRHYVQELEARLLHMEEVFKQVAPVVEMLGKSQSGVILPALDSEALGENGPNPSQTSQSVALKDKAPEGSPAASPASSTARSVKVEDDVSESFGQLALDEHGHLRWIGGSSTMSLVQSFRALTSSPLHRISPMEEDPHSPGPSATKLYFPASVFFGKVNALPGPEEVEYPERDLADKLVDAYFRRFHFLLPVVDKPSFLADYNHLMDNNSDVSLARSQTAFVALVFAVFACAARIVEDDRLINSDSGDDGGIGMVYYERALVLHYISHASIQIAHVQCSAILSSFLCSVNCLPQAWLLVGQAVRMGQDLGLHRLSRHLSISAIERETRRKVWWGVYSLDRMLALALGRPLGVQDSDCDAELPVDLDDEELPEYFQGAQLQRTQPSLMAGFIALAGLYKIAGRVCRQVYAIDKCKDNLEPEKMVELMNSVTALDKELSDWCEELPSAFKSNPVTEAQVSMGAVLCSHYYSILTTLHRNFLPIRQDHQFGPMSIAKAVSSARSCIRLAPSVKNVVPMSHHLTFFIQNLFSSTVILLLYAMHVSDRNAARAAMDEAESTLEVVSSWEGSWPGARKCRELLSDLTATANEAINNGTAPVNHTEDVVHRSGSSSTASSLQASPGSRAIKSKPNRRKSKSRDSHRSTRQIQDPITAGGHYRTDSATNVSQKRTHEEIEQVHGLASPSVSFHHTFPSSYPSGSNQNGQTSPTSAVISTSFLSDGREAQSQNLMATPVFVPPPGNRSTSSVHFDYGHSPSAQSESRTTTWASGQQSTHEMFGATSHGSTYQGPLQYHASPSTALDPNFMGYGSTPGAIADFSGQSDGLPSSFAASGLPFRGLDYIRNYTPGVYSEDGQESLWQSSFDAGEFRFDPDVQFTFGDFPTEGR